jgi:hypothetical protein
VTVPEDDFGRLARESGRLLGELGVRRADEKWIRAQAETIAGLAGARPRNRRLYDVFVRWARRAARAAR